MQITAGALVAFGLRVVTLVWPLATEALAVLWWSPSESPSRLPTLIIIIAYVCLVFAPRRFLFSRLGVAPVLLLTAASLFLLVRYWSEPSGVPEMIWVHLGFAIAWLATLVVEKVMRG